MSASAEPGQVNTPGVTGERLGHRDVALIALPIMLSNATQPLVGYVNVVVIGQDTGSGPLIGGVTIAAVIFNNIYWIFGFLRMGTTGLTAQATGAGNRPEIAANLWRAMVVAGVAGVFLVAAQALLIGLFLWLMGGSDTVNAAAKAYFDIRIWGAPAALANFALIGWFIGLGRASVAFQLQLLLNVLNIVLAIVFVLHWKMGIVGIGLAVLIAEIVAALAGIVYALVELRKRKAAATRPQVLDTIALRNMFAVNRDVIVRTVCLIFAFTFFAAQGARSGDLILAANSVLFAIAMIFTYMLDGFAFAAETHVGQAVGAQRVDRCRDAVRLTTIWALIVSLIFTAFMFLAGGMMIDFSTQDEAVRVAARDYLLWAALVPIVAVWCFQLDGIFIGATQTVAMRDMAVISTVIYVAAWFILAPAFGNHGLWASLMVLFVARAATLGWCYPRLLRDKFPAAA